MYSNISNQHTLIVCFQKCNARIANHKDELELIRNLVADISKHLGMENSGLLKKDVDVLGQKLDNVKNTLTQLRNLADDVGHKKLAAHEQQDVLRGIKEVIRHSLITLQGQHTSVYSRYGIYHIPRPFCEMRNTSRYLSTQKM